MEGNLFISGEIGSYDDVKGFELTDLISQVQKNKDALSYNVYIDSIGGSVDVGFDIYNYLKSLNKPITTIGSGVVASIATVIFLAGDIRKLRPNTVFMIHSPFGGITGTAIEIDAYNDVLKQAEKKLISFYKDITGLSEEALKPMLRNETFLNSEQAFEFGFTTGLEVEQMVAKLNIKNQNMNITKEDKNWFESLFSNLAKKFDKPKNIMLLDANGVEVNFPDVEEGQAPTVGSVGTVGGAPVPDGEYIMPSLENASVVFVGGVVTEIKEVADDSEMEALKTENENLKIQVQELTAKFETETNKIAEIKKEFTAMKSEISAKFEISPKAPKEEPTEISERMLKLKSKLNK